MRRVLDGCEWALTLAAALATFVMMLLTTADAGGRYLFNHPILAAYEITTNYLMVAAVFLAMPYAYRQGANIRVTFLVNRLGRTRGSSSATPSSSSRSSTARRSCTRPGSRLATCRPPGRRS